MTRDQLVEVLSNGGQGVGRLNPAQVEWIMSLVDGYATSERDYIYTAWVEGRR